MIAKPVSYYLSPALLALSTVLAAENWYLRPERAAAWATVVLVLGCMALALLLLPRRRPADSNEGEAAGRRSGDSIRRGIVTAGLILAISLSAKLAATLGVGGSADLSQRATMAIMGAFLMFTGNGIPKTLKPLSALRGDAARAQALQRFTGWTWVLAGLTLMIIWLVLPIDLAQLVSFLLLPSSILITVAQAVRLCRATAAGGGSTPGQSQEEPCSPY